MENDIKLIYLVLILALNFSCTEKSSKQQESYQPGGLVHSKADTLKFSSGIRAIFQDSKGNYWIGSLQKGVAVYNGNSFKYFTSNEGLSDNQIHSIQEDKKGVIWFNTQTGVSSYDGTRIRNHTKMNNLNAANAFFIHTNISQGSEWMKTDDDLWFEAGNKAGVYRYDGQRLHYLDLPPQKILNPSDNLFAVTDISNGRNNMIWFATYAGVFGYNGSNFTIINDETLGYDREIERLHIRSIFEDSKGRLWMGNNGLGVLLKEGDAVVNFSRRHRLIGSNSKGNGEQSPRGTMEHVFTIAEDKRGNIWFGDRDAGVWKFDGQKFDNYTQKNGLVNDFVLSIYEDRNEELWFGMADGSVYKFNGQAFEKQF